MHASSAAESPPFFPGFQILAVEAGGVRFSGVIGGNGPPVLLLHGYPQTHVMWRRVAPALAGAFTLVIPDLPGYGNSAAPEATADHAPYNKRAMAAVLAFIAFNRSCTVTGRPRCRSLA